MDQTNSAASNATAIVLGSGIAGLATAEVLSEQFGRVLVLERDHPEANSAKSAVEIAREDERGGARPGVPQGLIEFDTIFQGRYSPALLAAGANIVNQYDSYPFTHPKSGLQPWLRNTNPSRGPTLTAIASRHLFETTARQLVSGNPHVEFGYGAMVAGLVFDDGQSDVGGAGGVAGETEEEGAAAAAADRGQRVDKQAPKAVTGVRLSDGTCISAQLVVDCSGRGSALPGWLAAAGYKRPRTTRASCNTGYSGWFAKLAPEVDAALRSNNIYLFTALPAAPVRTCVLVMRTEEGWLVGVGGNEGHYPKSHQQEDLLEFAQKEVWHPSGTHLLSGSTPLAPACVKQGLGSTWRHYEEGMTVAAIEAVALQKLLRARRKASSSNSTTSCSTTTAAASNTNGSSCGSGSESVGTDGLQLQGLHRDLQKAVLPTIRLAWQMAAGADMRYPTATTNDTSSTSFARLAAVLVAGYFDTLFSYAGTDAVINEQVLRVSSMTDDPSTLLQPSILARVLFHKLADCVPAPIAAAVPRLVSVCSSWLPWAVGSSGTSSKGGGVCGGAGDMCAVNSHRCSDELLRILGVGPTAPAASAVKVD